LYSYRPKPSVYCVSVTGDKCELGCEHCRGKYLRGMEAVGDQNDLLGAFVRAKSRGARFILISGGFDRMGKLPVMDFLEAIRQGKNLTELVVEIHSGLIFETNKLREVGVDALLLDVVGDQETIERYLKGTWSVEDYKKMLQMAKKFIPLVAAHILVGVDGGKIKGEFDAVELVAEAGADALSILTLMDVKTPKLDEIAKVMNYAREKFKGHLTLGCMRTKGRDRPELERIAVDLGFDGIANPLHSTLRYAESAGVQVTDIEGCCIFTPDRISKNTKRHQDDHRAGRRDTST